MTINDALWNAGGGDGTINDRLDYALAHPGESKSTFAQVTVTGLEDLVDLSIKTVAAQTANAVEIKDSADAVKVSISPLGVGYFAGALSTGVAAGAQLHAKAAGTTTVVGMLEAVASQTANILTVKDSAGATIYGVKANGVMYNVVGTNSLVIGNTAFGTAVGFASSDNLVVGTGALARITTGNGHVAIGTDALAQMSDASFDIAIGLNALYWALGVYHSVAIGREALISTVYGSGLTAMGAAVARNLVDGSRIVAIGQNAARYSTGTTAATGFNDSVFIGADTKVGAATGVSNTVVIGYDATSLGSNSVVLGNDSITLTALKGQVDCKTTAGAFLPPRLTTAQRTALTGAAGMMVYDTDLGALCIFTDAWHTIDMTDI